MGYYGRIAGDSAANDSIKIQAETIKRQSMKIKDLVADLNLVSQLEYDMQPVHKEPVRLSRLLRSYTAELLSTEIFGNYTVELHIPSSAETLTLDCDARLISRAVGNLVQNSIRHNPEGCSIVLGLTCTTDTICLSVSDNGVGLSADKLRELKEKPHYMESTDDKLDLRHGLGLILVRQIADAHKGRMQIESEERKGFRVSLIFSKF